MRLCYDTIFDRVQLEPQDEELLRKVNDFLTNIDKF
jgi:hypothetical protein